MSKEQKMYEMPEGIMGAIVSYINAGGTPPGWTVQGLINLLTAMRNCKKTGEQDNDGEADSTPERSD